MKLPITLPYDDFFNMTETMLFSNPYLVFRTNEGNLTMYGFAHSRDFHRRRDTKLLTITSIEVRLPQFSIGDTVMIVDTGEIGEIKGIEGKYGIIAYYKVGDFVYPISSLVKINPDLLPILQD